jgi:hypothetical protein
LIDETQREITLNELLNDEVVQNNRTEAYGDSQLELSAENSNSSNNGHRTLKSDITDDEEVNHHIYLTL